MKYFISIFLFLASSHVFASELTNQKIEYYQKKGLNIDLFLLKNNTFLNPLEIRYFFENYYLEKKFTQKAVLGIFSGNIYKEYFNYDSALTIYERTLLNLNNSNKNKKRERLKIITYLNISKINHVQNDTIELKKNLLKAIQLAEKYNFSDLETESYIYYIKYYIDKKEGILQFYLNKAIRFYEEMQLDANLRMCYLLQSLIHKNNHRNDSAHIFIDKALGILSSDSLKSMIYYLKADLNFDLKKDFAVIEKDFFKSLELAQKNNQFDQIKKTSDRLFSLYESQKMFEKAFETLVLSKKMKDSIATKKTQKKILLANIQNELSIKENLITSLEYKELQNNYIIQEYKNNRRIISLIVYLIFVVFLIFAGIIFFSIKYNQRIKKNNESLEISNKELEQAKADLEKLGRNKDRFFSIIAHDLRSPFNSVLGLSEYISESMEELDKEDVLKFNNMIYSSSKSLYNLLENLLDWSKAQIGQLKFLPEKVNLYSVAENELEILKIIAKNKNISVLSNIPLDSIGYFDKDMISTVIRNITNNAIKFTPEGGQIKIEAYSTEKELIMSIDDSGIGISEENLSKIFSSDKQFTTHGTNGEKGTGLGLAICKEFLMLHNGNIQVSSTLGKGTKFTFSIPTKEN